MDDNPLMALYGDSSSEEGEEEGEEDYFEGDDDDDDDDDDDEDEDEDVEEYKQTKSGSDSDLDDPLAISSSKSQRKGKRKGKKGGASNAVTSQKLAKAEARVDRLLVKITMQKDIIKKYENHMEELESGLKNATEELIKNDSLIDSLRVEIKSYKVRRMTIANVLKGNGKEGVSSAKERIAAFQRKIVIATADEEIGQRQRTHAVKNINSSEEKKSMSTENIEAEKKARKKDQEEFEELEHRLNDKIDHMKDEFSAQLAQEKMVLAHSYEVKRLNDQQLHENQLKLLNEQLATTNDKLSQFKVSLTARAVRKAARKSLMPAARSKRSKSLFPGKTTLKMGEEMTASWSKMLKRTSRASGILSNFYARQPNQQGLSKLASHEE